MGEYNSCGILLSKNMMQDGYERWYEKTAMLGGYEKSLAIWKKTCGYFFLLLKEKHPKRGKAVAFKFP